MAEVNERNVPKYNFRPRAESTQQSRERARVVTVIVMGAAAAAAAAAPAILSQQENYSVNSESKREIKTTSNKQQATRVASREQGKVYVGLAGRTSRNSVWLAGRRERGPLGLQGQKKKRSRVILLHRPLLNLACVEYRVCTWSVLSSELSPAIESIF